MPALVDNILAYRILTMLVKPFQDTQAYKLGIIDAQGNNLIKSKDFNTTEQKDAYTYLDRLCFNVKKIINRTPGGESQLKNVITAFFLIKEAYHNKLKVIREDRFHKILNLLDSGYILVEDELIINKYLREDGMVAANVTGANVSTDVPVVKKKLKKKVVPEVIAR